MLTIKFWNRKEKKIAIDSSFRLQFKAEMKCLFYENMIFVFFLFSVASQIAWLSEAASFIGVFIIEIILNFCGAILMR